MKSKHTLIIIILLIVNLLLSAYLFFFKSNLKIAFVRSHDLVYNYEGMKEAQHFFELNHKQAQSNLDTLQSDFQKILVSYNEKIGKSSLTEKKEMESELDMKRNNILNYSKSIQNKFKEEDDKMTQGVLNQINEFVESYGKSKGYDIVLGTTLSGSLIYGNSAIDITDEVLLELNKRYKGK